MSDKIEAMRKARWKLAWKDFWKFHLRIFLFVSAMYIVGLLLSSHDTAKAMLSGALATFVAFMVSLVLSFFIAAGVYVLSPSRRQRCPSCGMTAEEKFDSGTQCSHCAQRMEPGPHIHMLWDWITISILPVIIFALAYGGSLPKNLNYLAIFLAWLVWTWFFYRKAVKRHAKLPYCKSCGLLLLPESPDLRSFEETKASGLGLCRLCREGATKPMMRDSVELQQGEPA